MENKTKESVAKNSEEDILSVAQKKWEEMGVEAEMEKAGRGVVEVKVVNKGLDEKKFVGKSPEIEVFGSGKGVSRAMKSIDFGGRLVIVGAIIMLLGVVGLLLLAIVLAIIITAATAGLGAFFGFFLVLLMWGIAIHAAALIGYILPVVVILIVLGWMIVKRKFSVLVLGVGSITGGVVGIGVGVFLLMTFSGQGALGVVVATWMFGGGMAILGGLLTIVGSRKSA